MVSLLGIATKTGSRTPMRETTSAHVSVDSGLEGDFRGKPGKRQISLLSHEAWQQACAELNAELPWTTRRANLLLSGITFGPEDVGKILAIGEVQLQITRETDPCKRMDEAHQGLKEALLPRWRGGVCCRVLKPGEIRIGDSVQVFDPQTA